MFSQLRLFFRFFCLLSALLLLGGEVQLLAAQPAPRPLKRQPGWPKLPAGPLAFRTSDSVRLFVSIAGQGLPCLVVHGGPGAGSYGLEHLGLKPLESSLQLIYLDQRGSGRSASAPRHDYRLARQVQDLEELRQRLGLPRWVLLAHSFGGVIATAYATRYPEHVQALILVNAVLNPTSSLESIVHYADSLLPAGRRPQLPPTLPLMQRVGPLMQALGQQGLAYQLQYAADTTAARASRVVQQPGNRDFAAHVFDYPEYGRDYAPSTAQLRMPVLGLAGHDDYTAGPRSYRTWQFGQQQVVVLPGRHNLLLEQPARSQQLIRAFVTALPQRP